MTRQRNCGKSAVKSAVRSAENLPSRTASRIPWCAKTGCYAADYAARVARNRRGEPSGELHGSPVSPIGEKYEAGCGRNRRKPTKTYTALHLARARLHQNYYKILQLTALHAGAGASRPGFCGLTGGSGSGAIGNSGSGAFRSTWRGRSLPSAPTVLSNWRIPPVDSNSFRCTPTVSW